MAHDDSVTDWIDALRMGDGDAAEQLWHRYFQQLVQQARSRLQGARRTVTDEEDVALSAFNSFCVAARAGRFPRLMDRSNLWPLLLVIVSNKSVDVIRHQNRQRRGGTGAAPAESANGDEPGIDSESKPLRSSRHEVVDLETLPSREPTPELAAALCDEVQSLLDRLDDLDDPDLQRIVLMKLEGDDNVTIAAACSCARRTVERKLAIIRRLLEESDASDVGAKQ